MYDPSSFHVVLEQCCVCFAWVNRKVQNSYRTRSATKLDFVVLDDNASMNRENIYDYFLMFESIDGGY
jgi:hypothetical protein